MNQGTREKKDEETRDRSHFLTSHSNCLSWKQRLGNNVGEMAPARGCWPLVSQPRVTMRSRLTSAARRSTRHDALLTSAAQAGCKHGDISGATSSSPDETGALVLPPVARSAASAGPVCLIRWIWLPCFPARGHSPSALCSPPPAGGKLLPAITKASFN